MSIGNGVNGNGVNGNGANGNGATTPTSFGKMRLTGYADKFGVNPGSKIKFHVNCDGPSAYDVEIVQMINGDTNPRGPGLIEHSVSATCNSQYIGRKQAIYSGSYGYILDRKHFRVDSFTLQCWIWPTMPKTDPSYWKHGAQGILSKWHKGQGYGLFINENGCLELRINDKKVVGAPLRDHAWHFIAATFDATTGKAILYQEPQIVYALDPETPPIEKFIDGEIEHNDAPFVIAGYAERKDPNLGQSSVPKGVIIGGHYNGKIDSPRVCDRALNRVDIETMKLGTVPGLDEIRGMGPIWKT